MTARTPKRAKPDALAKLLGCPFCGGRANAHSMDGTTAYVRCGECGTVSGVWPTERMAIHAWNTRYLSRPSRGRKP
jgi:Lar family restriction alleviation protein